MTDRIHDDPTYMSPSDRAAFLCECGSGKDRTWCACPRNVGTRERAPVAPDDAEFEAKLRNAAVMGGAIYVVAIARSERAARLAVEARASAIIDRVQEAAHALEGRTIAADLDDCDSTTMACLRYAAREVRAVYEALYRDTQDGRR